VPTSYDSRSPPARLTLKTVAPNRIEIDPFPFDVNPLRVQLVRRKLERDTFPDTATFRETFFKTTPEAVDFALCPRSS
jgi:hypothetical protein